MSLSLSLMQIPKKTPSNPCLGQCDTAYAKENQAHAQALVVVRSLAVVKPTPSWRSDANGKEQGPITGQDGRLHCQRHCPKG